MTKLLLTSVGLSTPALKDALTSLTGKPLDECRAVVVPTAIHALPEGPAGAAQTVHEVAGYGFSALGVVELTALPTLPEDCWLPDVEAADVVMVGGGNGAYLSHWTFASGFADLLPALLERGAVYVGVSAGSILVTPGFNAHAATLEATGRYWDDEYDEWGPEGAASDRGLGLVDLVVRPHYNASYYPTANRSMMVAAASKVAVPLYAIDDATAVSVVDGVATVVGDGEWELFEPGRTA